MYAHFAGVYAERTFRSRAWIVSGSLSPVGLVSPRCRAQGEASGGAFLRKGWHRAVRVTGDGRPAARVRCRIAVLAEVQ